jgi:mannose-6-phosphate isomerase
LWAHTEAVKAALAAGNMAEADRWLGILYKHFLQPNGGWRDLLDADGTVKVEFMPASSFYHVMCALSEYAARRGE